MSREIISREMAYSKPSPKVIVGVTPESASSTDSGIRTALKVGLIASAVYLIWSYTKGM